MTASKRSVLVRYPRDIPEEFRGGVATIGNFDGVHLGHEHIVRALTAHGHGRPAAVITFYPHPVKVLTGSSEPRAISSIREKAERFGGLGVSLVYLVHFTRSISQMTAQQFIEEVLVKRLAIRGLVVGEDVAIGRKREGTLDYLAKELPKYSIQLHVVPQLQIAGVRPGSRIIRALLEQGEMERAQVLLGAPFTISARVGHGDKRGAQLGFPTANVALHRRLTPKRGVYACRVEVDGVKYRAVANVGVRPTFNGAGERLEVHLLDYSGESLYARRLKVTFLSFLRDEMKFDSAVQLKAQIEIDVQAARVLLGHE
jgi:riboflavin kinase/FMN adenylyltransferase